MEKPLLKILLLDDLAAEQDVITAELTAGNIYAIESKVALANDSIDEMVKRFHPDVILTNRTVAEADKIVNNDKHESDATMPIISMSELEAGSMQQVLNGMTHSKLKLTLAGLPSVIGYAMKQKHDQIQQDLLVDALQNQVDHFKFLLHQWEVGSLIIPLTTMEWQVNGGILQLLGIPQTAESKNIFSYLIPEDRSTALSFVVNQLQRPAEKSEVKLSFKTADGKTQQVQITAVLRDEHIHGIMLPMPEQINPEISLQAEVESLKSMNQDLTTFISSIGHDLRSPINSLKGIVSLAQDEVHDEVAKEYMGYIESTTSKLENLVNDLLHYFKNWKGELNTEKIEVYPLINSVFESLQFVEGYKEVEKIIEIPEALTFNCDKIRLQILFTNLISNAIKYRDKGKRNAMFKLKAEVVDGRFIFQIKDNGIGIREKDHSKVFNMFYKGTQQPDSVGLGLYIVKATVEKLKGKIAFNSKEGVGTEFEIQIPELEIK